MYITISKQTPKPVEPGINETSIIEFEEGGKSSAREGIVAQVQEYVLFKHNIWLMIKH